MFLSTPNLLWGGSWGAQLPCKLVLKRLINRLKKKKKKGMVKKSEDMRDVLVHSLLSRDHSTSYPGIDPSRHGLGSGDSIAPSLGVWAILYVVVDSTRPCPTGALD